MVSLQPNSHPGNLPLPSRAKNMEREFFLLSSHSGYGHICPWWIWSEWVEWESAAVALCPHPHLKLLHRQLGKMWRIWPHETFPVEGSQSPFRGGKSKEVEFCTKGHRQHVWKDIADWLPIPCSVLQPFSSFPSRVNQPCNSTGEPWEALRKSSREERVSSVMQNKTRKRAARKPHQSGPHLCSAAGAGAVSGTPEREGSLLPGNNSGAGRSETATGAAGWQPPEAALRLVLLHITQLEKTRCDKITLKQSPKGKKESGSLLRSPLPSGRQEEARICEKVASLGKAWVLAAGTARWKDGDWLMGLPCPGNRIRGWKEGWFSFSLDFRGCSRI